MWSQQLALRERPPGQPVMRQAWDRLLFLHWRYPAEQLQARLPPGLTIDTHEGDAWLGVVPFFMRGIRLRGLPRIPTASDFLEVNLRTYVHDQHGTPGVWFFSLDANSWLTVWGARTWFRLPYQHARMTAACDPTLQSIDYQSHRRRTAVETASRFTYCPRGEPRVAETGSLDFFLLERYLLFAEGWRGRLYSGRVWHAPYRITDVELSAWDDRLIGLNGFESPGRLPDHVVMAPGVEVEIFGLRRQI